MERKKRLEEKLKELREYYLKDHKDLKPKDVAKKFNITLNTLNGLENGTKKPSRELIKQIKELYGCTYEYLLDDNCLEPYGNIGSIAKLDKATISSISILTIHKNGETFKDILFKLMSPIANDSMSSFIQCRYVYSELYEDIEALEKNCQTIWTIIKNKKVTVKDFNKYTNTLEILTNYCKLEDKVEQRYYKFLMNEENIKSFIDCIDKINAYMRTSPSNLIPDGELQDFKNYKEFINALRSYKIYLENILNTFKLI